MPCSQVDDNGVVENGRVSLSFFYTTFETAAGTLHRTEPVFRATNLTSMPLDEFLSRVDGVLDFECVSP